MDRTKTGESRMREAVDAHVAVLYKLRMICPFKRRKTTTPSHGCAVGPEGIGVR
jgi:hypothetical protein